MRANFVVLALAAILGLGSGVHFALRRDESPRAAPAAVAALFSTPFEDLQSQKTTLARWQDVPVVVNFWATWCPPCREEMPDLSRLQERHPDVRFVGVAIDAAAKVADFAARYPVTYPLFVAAGDGMALSHALGNEKAALPHTVIVYQGKVAFSKLGRIDPAEVDERVRRIATSSR